MLGFKTYSYCQTDRQLSVTHRRQDAIGSSSARPGGASKFLHGRQNHTVCDFPGSYVNSTAKQARKKQRVIDLFGEVVEATTVLVVGVRINGGVFELVGSAQNVKIKLLVTNKTLVVSGTTPAFSSPISDVDTRCDKRADRRAPV